MKAGILISILFIACCYLALRLFLGQKKFGAFPTGTRLRRIQASPHWQNGAFANTVPSPRRAEGVSFARMLCKFWFGKKDRLIPESSQSFIRVDIASLDKAQDTLVWFGHSSFYLLQNGLSILVDPVFSANAAPFFFSTKAFPGTMVHSPDDIPQVDYLLISHDHWDHLDYKTVTALRGKIGKIVCGLGVGAHLERWGFAGEDIVEGDWGEALRLEQGFTVHLRTTRHFSGRTLRADQSLWAGFVLETPGRRIYYSGDGGYGEHFAQIGREFGPIDLAILENGQYDANWKYMHMVPEEVAQAAIDLHAKVLFPVHNGKFSIASHPWDEPYRRIVQASKGKPYKLLTPIIGEPVFL